MSREQAQALMSLWRHENARHWIKIVAIHHNPVPTIPANVKSWVDHLNSQVGTLKAETISHFVSDAVGLEGHENLRAVAEDCQIQLILHGHHHAAAKDAWLWTGATGQTLVLSAGSWGLRSNKLPADQPNMMHLVRIEPAAGKAQSVLRTYEPRARAEGHVQTGHFALDPAKPRGSIHQLTLSAGFQEGRSKRRAPSIEENKARELTQEYRTRLKRRYERWELSGVGTVQPGGAGKPIDASLDEMYLPLRLAQVSTSTKVDEGRIIVPTELIARKKPLVVRGAAGSGKTTWMRWTFRRLIELAGAMPFMIELRRLAYDWHDRKARGKERTIDSYLRDVVAESGVSGWEEVLPDVLKSDVGPRPVLLVDGWDELGEMGEELRDKLTGFLDAHPRVLAIVSSRPYGESRPSRSDGFEVLDLQPLSDAEIADFAERFHHRVYGEDVLASRDSTQRLLRALKNSHEALSLARTPLLLTMMLLISRDRPLPDKRHRLYEECIRNLLSARPEQKEKEGARLQQGQWRPSDSEARLRAVASMAFQMQGRAYHLRTFNGQIVASQRELEAMLPKKWRRGEKIGFLAWLVGAAGVMIDRTDGTLSFAHLSFQEYLAAYHLAASVEGDVARIQLCQQRMQDQQWWETLRLWAAVVGDRNPDHLSPVLSELIEDKSSGFWLAGAILADGPGEEAFVHWCERLHSSFHLDQLGWSDTSARAWAASRQEERRQSIGLRWPQLSQRGTWLSTALADDWREKSQIVMQQHERSAFDRLLFCADQGQEIGRAKILAAAYPLWPSKPMELVLLRLFPTTRITISMRLQMLLLLGRSRDELLLVARRLLAKPRDEFAHLLARSWVQSWRQSWGAGPKYELAWDLMRDIAQDMEQDLSRIWERDWGQAWAQELEKFFEKTLERARRRVLEEDWSKVSCPPTDWVSVWGKNWIRDLIMDWMRVPKASANALARDLGLAEVPEWIRDYATVELASMGRAWTRAVVAHWPCDNNPCLQLLQAACKASLRPDSDDYSSSLKKSLSAYPQSGDPLWPSLARHLARISTAEDRALLVDLAQHPEKRSGALSLGLKYYVRGDLVFEDGSEMTLDDLCDQLKVPRLPYLGEMLPEPDLFEDRTNTT